MGTSELLALLNDILQSVIVIFGGSVVLYNTKYLGRDRLIRGFSILVTAVVLVYFTELLVSRTHLASSTQIWLTLNWLGITFMPAVQFHFADELLTTTGSFSRRRKWATLLCYLISFFFFLAVLFTDWIVTTPIYLPHATHWQGGRFINLFALSYLVVAIFSVQNVWRAYRRGITRRTKEQILRIFFAVMAGPLAVFPYLSLLNRSNPSAELSVGLWLILILGNLLIGWMFAQLTASVAYLGSVSSDRVVRVRLYKFMARVPMTASLVLLVYVLTIRATSILGLDPIAGTGFMVVATVILVEWAVHAYKGRLERMLQFNNEPDVRRIQALSERLLTRQDLQQFLESLLAAGCDTLRIPSAFVVSTTGDRPIIEAMIGPPISADNGLLSEIVTKQTQTNTSEWWQWQSYWLKPLRDQQQGVLLGLLGLQLPQLTFNAQTEAIIARLETQTAAALEDRVLQEQVFAAVEGLLPAITALQARRASATFSGKVLLEEGEATPESADSDPEFVQQVRDALNHIWGGPKLTESPLLSLDVVQSASPNHEGNAIKALRSVLHQAIEQQRPPEGEPTLMNAEWVLYNILELKFVQGMKVRDVARRLAMSESDLYRKQRVAIENVARAIQSMESKKLADVPLPPDSNK